MYYGLVTKVRVVLSTCTQTWQVKRKHCSVAYARLSYVAVFGPGSAWPRPELSSAATAATNAPKQSRHLVSPAASDQSTTTVGAASGRVHASPDRWASKQ